MYSEKYTYKYFFVVPAQSTQDRENFPKTYMNHTNFMDYPVMNGIR